MRKPQTLTYPMPETLAVFLRDLRDHDKVMALAIWEYLRNHPHAAQDMMDILDE